MLPRLQLFSALVCSLLLTGDCCRRRTSSQPSPGRGNINGNGNSNSNGNGNSNSNRQSSNNGAPNPLKNKMGIEGSDTLPYNDDTFLRKGSAVGGPEELTCQFNGDQCCWGNVQPPSDQLEWRTSGARPEPTIFTQNFDAPPPADGFLITAASETDPYVQARFVSCSIECSDDPVKVTLNHWSTKEVELKVCTQETFGDDNLVEEALLLNCVVLPRENSPGPSTVTLPPGNLFDVVIVASNFVEPGGGVALIDSISVDYAPCNGNNEQDPPCPYIDPFEDDQSPLFSVIDKSFGTEQGRFENRITGVPSGRDGRDDKYMAAYLLPGEKAGLDSGPLTTPQDGVFRYDHYEAVYDFQQKVCLDDVNNCPFSTNEKADASDRGWKTTSILIPKGTRRLFILVENNGRNQGALGLDNMEWLKPSQQRPTDPDAANEPECVQ